MIADYRNKRVWLKPGFECQQFVQAHADISYIKGSRAATSLAIMLDTIQANKHLEIIEIKKLIDAAYPFGMRRYQPYTAWLKVRKAVFEALDHWCTYQREKD